MQTALRRPCQDVYKRQILSYLELHPQNFYQINADVDGTQFVTARGWEDLSNLLDTYEQLGLQADEDLIKEYIQHPKIAEDFSAYLDPVSYTHLDVYKRQLDFLPKSVCQEGLRPFGIPAARVRMYAEK